MVILVGFIGQSLIDGRQLNSRDGTLRRQRRVQRRKMHGDSHVIQHSFSPLNAGWDGAARHPYQTVVVFR
jgi:hypothetical protein